MKAIAFALLLGMLLPQDPAPVVEYRDGKISPVSRAVAQRPLQAQPATSKALTGLQWYEIRVAMLEAEVFQLEARLAGQRKLELIREARKVLNVDESWLFNVETMRFEAPKENK